MAEPPLMDLDRRAGATFGEIDGHLVVESYGSDVEETVAARAFAGVFDRSHRAKVRVTGEDRLTFLDGLVTNDVKTLEPGRVLYAAVLTEKGRVVGDLRLYGFPDHYLLDIARDVTTRVLGYFEKHLISDDVQLMAIDGTAQVSVTGPGASWLVAHALGRATVPRVGRFVALEDTRYRQVLLSRTDPLGLPGFDLFALRGSLEGAWRELLAGGGVPAGRDAWEILRIEAGIPRVGVDADEDVLALEARLDGAISLTKGCYVGQEVVARATHIGRLRRHLTGLVVGGDVVPVKADTIRAGESKIGHVTSAVWSPHVGLPVALGYVRDEYAKPGARLIIDHGGWRVQARVASLPFVG